MMRLLETVVTVKMNTNTHDMHEIKLHSCEMSRLQGNSSLKSKCFPLGRFLGVVHVDLASLLFFKCLLKLLEGRLALRLIGRFISSARPQWQNNVEV